MNRRSIARLLMAASLATSVAVYAVTPAPGTCPNDSKLLNDGPTQISGEGPGTWWGLVVNGLLVAGFVDEDDQIDYLNDIFGTSFAGTDVYLSRRPAFGNGNGGATVGPLPASLIGRVRAIDGVAKADGQIQGIGSLVVNGKFLSSQGGAPNLVV